MRHASRPNYQATNFANITPGAPPRSVLNRSRNYKTTFDAGFLIPIYVEEVLPGDTVSCRPRMFARMATPIFPVLDNLYLESWFFFVPNRLVWSNFKKFMGEQANPGDSTSYTIPQLVSPTNGFARGGVADYMGIPPLATTGTTHSVNALPFRAMNLIYNEWFRDQALQNSVTVNTGDGPDAESTYALLRRGKRKDYFTSSLPYPQKGDAVVLPLGTTAPVNFTLSTTNRPQFQNAAGTKWGSLEAATSVTDPTLKLEAGAGTFTGGEDLYWKQLGFSAATDLSTATAATVNQLRTAFQLQRLAEAEARGGTRYTEWVRTIFGVTSPDARLQRPEYLGGGSINISVNPVPVTGMNDSETRPIGNLGGYATASGTTGNWTFSSTEHGFIIGLACVRADLNYQQGTHRMWNRLTKADHYVPQLAHLGEQAVLNKEIYTDGTSADNDVWGYQERWSEYRYAPNIITGKLRTSDPLALDSWHLAQSFTTRPALNDTFIKETPPMSRVIAVTGEPHFIMDVYFEQKSARPMPTFSVPGMIDHF